MSDEHARKAPQEEEGKFPDPDPALVDRAKETGEVIVFSSRIGATPYMKYTPYQTNRGVKVDMWSCISWIFKAMPGRALLGRPVVVWPDESDDYEVNRFTDEWVKGQVMHSRLIELQPPEETPFDGMALGGWIDE